MIMLSVRFCVHCRDLCSFLCPDCRQLVFQLILKWCLLSMELRSEDTRVHSRIKYISVRLESLIFVICMFNCELLYDLLQFPGQFGEFKGVEKMVMDYLQQPANLWVRFGILLSFMLELFYCLLLLSVWIYAAPLFSTPLYIQMLVFVLTFS